MSPRKPWKRPRFELTITVTFTPKDGPSRTVSFRDQAEDIDAAMRLLDKTATRGQEQFGYWEWGTSNGKPGR